MASVELKVEDFEKSEVPPVCVFTGVPSENVFRFRFDGVSGGLPVNGEAIASLARLRRVILLLAFASVASFGLAIASGASLAALLAVGFMVVALATTLSARRKLVTGRILGDQLLLDKVHPAFVSAATGPPLGKCSTCPTLADCPSHNSDAPRPDGCN